jgi:hypothetical protein
LKVARVSKNQSASPSSEPSAYGVRSVFISVLLLPNPRVNLHAPP